MLDELTEFVTNLENYTIVPIDFDDNAWHVTAQIAAEPGWYFFTTSTPRDVFTETPLWAQQAPNANGALVDVRNNDLQERAAQYYDELAGIFSDVAVYSGHACGVSVQQRAKQHTFPDPQTAGLALGRYPQLRDYNWQFHYAYLSDFMAECPNPKTVLELGEQVWRANFGWPVLCKK